MVQPQIGNGAYLGFEAVLSLPERKLSCRETGLQRSCLLCFSLPVRESPSCLPSVALDGSFALFLLFLYV